MAWSTFRQFIRVGGLSDFIEYTKIVGIYVISSDSEFSLLQYLFSSIMTKCKLSFELYLIQDIWRCISSNCKWKRRKDQIFIFHMIYYSNVFLLIQVLVRNKHIEQTKYSNTVYHNIKEYILCATDIICFRVILEIRFKWQTNRKPIVFEVKDMSILSYALLSCTPTTLYLSKFDILFICDFFFFCQMFMEECKGHDADISIGAYHHTLYAL